MTVQKIQRGLVVREGMGVEFIPLEHITLHPTGEIELPELECHPSTDLTSAIERGEFSYMDVALD